MTRLYVLLLTFLVGTHSLPGQEQNQDVSNFISWLPNSTETIVALQHQLTLREFDEEKASPLELVNHYVFGQLIAANKGSLIKKLYGLKVQSAVLAGRNFGNNSELDTRGPFTGLIAYEGCAIVQFQLPLAPHLFEGFSIVSISGHSTWIESGRQYEPIRKSNPRKDSYRITLLKPNILLTCNNKAFFESVLEAFDLPFRRSHLNQTPEWNQVDHMAPVWGIRHFNRHRSEDDPTQAEKDTDPFATGLAFQFDSRMSSIRARCISTARTDYWQAWSDISALEGKISSRQISPEVWELAVKDLDVTALPAIFTLMAQLGFAIYV